MTVLVPDELQALAAETRRITVLTGIAREAGATVVEINPQPTGISDEAHHVWRATAAVGIESLAPR